MSDREEIEGMEQKFAAEALAKGHYLKRDPEDGDIDFMAMDVEGHNGPICENCLESWCVHCWNQGGDEIKPCPKPIIECTVVEEKS